MKNSERKKWELAPDMPAGFASQVGELDSVVAQLLYNRGIRDRDQKNNFLQPAYSQLNDPFLMTGMDRAVKRLIQAIESNERILIFGDYDVDGCCATAIMLRVLRFFGVNADYYIPHRIREGYGLSHEAIDEICERGAQLMITVDNGSSSYDEVEYAKQKGLDVIITDHHEVTKELPDCVAVINPRQKGDEYPCKDLCGAGVAFQCMRALVLRMKECGREELSEDMLKWYLDLVALATVADVMKLDGENRIFVYYGLLVLRKTQNAGLRAIGKIAGIHLGQAQSRTLGFQIAPRINAAGRMAHAEYALTLLTTDNTSEAEMLALQLERLNRERQASVARHLADLSDSIGDSIPSVLVMRNDAWTSGILGLIAGRLSERFARPVFCAALEGDVIKGSARSSVDFDIVAALQGASDHLKKFGGHRLAGGFSLLPESYTDFKTTLEEVVDRGGHEFVQQLRIDCSLDIDDDLSQILTSVQVLEPFGNANPEPLFLSESVAVAEARAVGSDSTHLRIVLYNTAGQKVNGIAFGMGELAENLVVGKKVSVVYSLQENEWGGRKHTQLVIRDLRLEE